MPDDLILLSGGPLDGQHVPRPDGRSLLVELSWTSMLARYRQTRDRDVYRFKEYDESSCVRCGQTMLNPDNEIWDESRAERRSWFR